MGTGKYNPNRDKKKGEENKTVNNGPFICKQCGGYTFGAPIRRNNQNFCEYCIEKNNTGNNKQEEEEE